MQESLEHTCCPLTLHPLSITNASVGRSLLGEPSAATSFGLAVYLGNE